ncbi:hypothetical protein V757_03455 [Pelistega indica]|uniref:Uncharacterized protein n=1 Tax=Pelistega indica TaxID=1414851 RepID=V8G918_9BURK|nr:MULTISPECIES: hypothetical protein [Pelistega]ETD72591.1 hypothetical protein V757_03455 [Pelistega indica]
MKKVLLTALMALSATTAFAESEVDNRPARQKAQDMYVEPTLRMKQTTTTSNAGTGEVIRVEENTKVINHAGDVVGGTGTTTPEVAPQAQPTQGTMPAPAVQPQPEQVKPAVEPMKKEITDKSRVIQ